MLWSPNNFLTTSREAGGVHPTHPDQRITTTQYYSIVAIIFPFLFPALGGLLFGYDIGATSCATINMKSDKFSGTRWYHMSSVGTGLITSGSLYGALIGSALAFKIADFLGRRRELIVAALFYLSGAIVTAAGPDLAVVVVGRFVYGVGIGLAMHAAPMYIAEMAPSQIRGRLLSVKEFFIVLGMVLGYGVGSFLVNKVSGWRYMYTASVPLSVIMGIGIWWIPESPRWLLLCAIQGKGNMHDLKENSVSCLCRLWGKSNGDTARKEIDEILAELSSEEKEKQVTIWEMLRGKCLKALTIGVGLVVFQQITGQPSVLYYAGSILEIAGFPAASDATRVSILLGLLKLIMTGVAVLAIDRIGRRPLLLGGVFVMGLSLFLLGSYYLFLKDMPALAVTALLLYVGCYQLSFGPIGWLMISEIFPLRLRGRGLSVTVLMNFGSNALIAFAFSPLKAWLGAGILFYVFGGFTVMAVVFIFFIVPETKGRSLEEIEASFL